MFIPNNISNDKKKELLNPYTLILSRSVVSFPNLFCSCRVLILKGDAITEKDCAASPAIFWVSTLLAQALVVDIKLAMQFRGVGLGLRGCTWGRCSDVR